MHSVIQLTANKTVWVHLNTTEHSALLLSVQHIQCVNIAVLLQKGMVGGKIHANILDT